MSSIWNIRRSATDTKLSGLCGGVATHWGVDPVLVRIGWALLALTGGVGVVLYVAGWLLVPVEGRTTSVADDMIGSARVRAWPRKVWVAIVVAACVISFSAFSTVTPFGLGSALVVAVIWYFGYYRHRGRRNPPASQSPVRTLGPVHPSGSVPPPVPDTPFGHAAAAWQARVQQVQGQPAQGQPFAAYAPPAAAYAPPPWTPDPVREEQPDPFWTQPDPVGLYVEPVATVTPPEPAARSRAARRLRLVVLLVLGLVLAGLGTADALGATVTPLVYAASALLVLALGLVAATWFGRARGLLGIAVLLAAAAVTTAAVSGPTGTALTTAPEIGERHLAYSRADAWPVGGDRLQAGELTTDLSALTLTSDATYTAHVELGHLEVTIPPDTGVRLTYASELGQVEALGEELQSGTDLAGTRELVPTPAGGSTLTLDLGVDHGQLEVVR